MLTSMPIPMFAEAAGVTYVVPVAIGTARFRKLSFSMRILSILCALALLEVIFLRYVGHLKIKNYFISQFYTALEVSFIHAVYFAAESSTARKRMIGGLGIGFFLIWLGATLFSHGQQQMGGWMSVVARIFLIAASLLAFQSLMADARTRLLESSLFWMVIAVILYSAGSMVTIGVSDMLLKTNYWQLYVVYHINWSLLIVANMLYSKALLCKS